MEKEKLTEKEKMLAGMLYDADHDEELVQDRIRAKDLCYDFNQLRPMRVKEQKEVMKKLLGKTEGAFQIIQPFWCDYGYNIEIGKNFYANHNLVILPGYSGLHKSEIWR